MPIAQTNEPDGGTRMPFLCSPPARMYGSWSCPLLSVAVAVAIPVAVAPLLWLCPYPRHFPKNFRECCRVRARGCAHPDCRGHPPLWLAVACGWP